MSLKSSSEEYNISEFEATKQYYVPLCITTIRISRAAQSAANAKVPASPTPVGLPTPIL